MSIIYFNLKNRPILSMQLMAVLLLLPLAEPFGGGIIGRAGLGLTTPRFRSPAVLMSTEVSDREAQSEAAIKFFDEATV